MIHRRVIPAIPGGASRRIFEPTAAGRSAPVPASAGDTLVGDTNELPCPRGRPGPREQGARLVGILLLSVSLLQGSCAALAAPHAFQPGRATGIVRDKVIREASGIVASRQNPGVLWIHNDSGDIPRVFAVTERGDMLGACRVLGATLRDWEDIAVGPGPDPNRQYLYIGEIGDNRGKYPEIVVYRVPEPKISATVPFENKAIGPADTLRLTYPDRPRDAETLLVDPLTRDIYIISKREIFSKVYCAGYPQSTTGRTEMKRVARMPWGFAVGGDVSPDGRRVIVRGMFNASLWERPADKPLSQAFAGRQIQVPVADEPQGEGICFNRNGTGYFTISEMARPLLYYYAPAEPNTTSTP